jgi:hypothetical protein
MADDLNADNEWFLSMMITSDGENWRWLSHGDPNHNADPIGLAPLYMAMEVADNPITGGVIPWNGNNNICVHSRDNLDYCLSYVNFNDSAQITATIDKDGTAGGPYVCWLYATSEMVTSAMLGQHEPPYKNNLQEEFELYPMGLFSLTSGVKGRHGTIADMWWGQDDMMVPVRHGSTYPVSGTGTHLSYCGVVLPWDGSIFRITQR